jgi:hypothetical protein
MMDGLRNEVLTSKKGILVRGGRDLQFFGAGIISLYDGKSKVSYSHCFRDEYTPAIPIHYPGWPPSWR